MNKTTNIKMWGMTVKAYYEEGTVYVYDAVAGHYTRCHSATPGQAKRVKALASRS